MQNVGGCIPENILRRLSEKVYISVYIPNICIRNNIVPTGIIFIYNKVYT
jgi:hypothetical protein